MAPVLAVLAAASLFGTTGTAQALAVGALGAGVTTPLGVGAARLVVGGLGLLVVLPLLGGSMLSALRLWRQPVALWAGVMTAFYQVCFFASVQRTGVAIGTLVTIGSGPVLAGVLSWVLLRERPQRAWVLATALCVLGLGLLAARGGGTADGLGVGLALASGLGYALYTVLARQLIVSGAPSSEVMAAAFGLGGLLLIPVLVTAHPAWIATGAGSALVLWLGLGTTTLAYVLFGRGLTVLPAGPVTTLVLAEPLVATVLSVLVLGERLSPLGWSGALLVLVGLAVQGLASGRVGPSDRQE